MRATISSSIALSGKTTRRALPAPKRCTRDALTPLGKGITRDSANAVTAAITNEAVEELKLAPGQAATAVTTGLRIRWSKAPRAAFAPSPTAMTICLYGTVVQSPAA